jgi:hypothetical protein
MTIQKRSIIAVVFLAAAMMLYGTANHYSYSLILFIVEQTLIQKAPTGTDPDRLHRSLHEFLSKPPDQNASMKKLLRISERLEKTQVLTPVELEDLIGPLVQ